MWWLGGLGDACVGWYNIRIFGELDNLYRTLILETGEEQQKKVGDLGIASSIHDHVPTMMINLPTET
jgi:hypothetical protein